MASKTRSDLAYRQLPELFYHDLLPNDPPDPKLVLLNAELASSFGLDEADLRSDKGFAALSGRFALGGGTTLAMAYAGHQFGHWSGMLGDGRARLIGDVTAKDGLQYELHLKGSGATPFSRRGDGKATLGSAVREYVMSEAMAALGVPTTRSISVVTTGERVAREGHPPGAILCRSARSHIRVGTFQLAAESDDIKDIKALADFALARLYPEIKSTGPTRYADFLKAVANNQARLIAKWMGLGFIHGVMNTDNMCVSGETIDYGPCAFIDNFHPAKTFSSIDRHGRYAWNQQTQIGQWNLAVLADALSPLLGDDDEARSAAGTAALEAYITEFETKMNKIWADKFGFADGDHSAFLQTTFHAMTDGKVDYTLFFSHLTDVAGGGDRDALNALFSSPKNGEEWLQIWLTKQENRLTNGRLNDQAIKSMRAVNPVIIPRNHQVDRAVRDAEAGDLETMRKLLDAIKDPFTSRPEFVEYEIPPEPAEIIHETFCGT